MEKVLRLYGVNDAPFPSLDNQIEIGQFRYEAKRMGNAPTISAIVYYPTCLDNEWDDNVYTLFNGEKYYLKQTPTSSYSNEDARYKHDVEFVSERVVLENVYFYDVVSDDTTNDKPVSNSTNFNFYGDIKQFASRLQNSLRYSNIGYDVEVDDDVVLENKLISFNDFYFVNALQEGYNVYDVPYYFVGKTIHFGYAETIIDYEFKQGIDGALLSINKVNSNEKIVNRITGVGSNQNIPYYYPNKDEKGEVDVLYNNTSGIVKISNEIKFKKVRLSDKFTYKDIPKQNVYLNSGDDYSVKGDIVNIEGNIYYLGDIIFPFTINNQIETYFSFSYSGGLNDIVSISIYKGRDIVESNVALGTFTRRYNSGEYEIRISLTFESEQQNNYINDIINRFGINIYQIKDAIKGWFLNDGYNTISLSDYGLDISGRTPRNNDLITNKQLSYIIPQTNLMPPIYRETKGKERFYNAIQETYVNPNNGEFYSFVNPYKVGNPKEYKETYDDIKPTIEGITNANNERIDLFLDFAYDRDDNDEFDEDGNYLHPYFFAKLRKFDGDYGFNLFDHSIESNPMTITMTSGSCGGCNFEIGVDSESQKNVVQVDDYGNLKRDSKGNVITSGEPQERQNNTKTNNVWIALKKDINTFGVIMPNVQNKYYPNTQDTFAILNIELPQGYITFAENKLKESLIQTMFEKNDEKFNFSIDFSRIFFEENTNILSSLNENAQIKVEYNSNPYDLFVSSFSYSMNENEPLPSISVDLFDSIEIKRNIIETTLLQIRRINEIKANKGSSLKDYNINDVKITKDKNIQVGRTSVAPITQHQEMKSLVINVNGVRAGAYNPNVEGVINIESGVDDEYVNNMIVTYFQQFFTPVYAENLLNAIRQNVPFESVTIGDARLEYSDGALRIVKADGSAMNLVVSGDASAFGTDENGGEEDSDGVGNLIVGDWVEGLEIKKPNGQYIYLGNVYMAKKSGVLSKPSPMNTDEWYLVQGNPTPIVEITSTNGVGLDENELFTTLVAKLTWANQDLTYSIPFEQWSWERVSDDSEGDAIWNSQHVGVGNEIALSEDDLLQIQNGVKFKVNVTLSHESWYSATGEMMFDGDGNNILVKQDGDSTAYYSKFKGSEIDDLLDLIFNNKITYLTESEYEALEFKDETKLYYIMED